MKRWTGSAVIAAAAVVAALPLQFGLGFSCGDDFDFHLTSWFDAQHSWRQGILYPHWAPSPNFFAGEPRFVFYPPLTWMLGAALHTIFPWQYVPLVLTFLLLFGLGLAVRRFAREGLGNAPATLAGCFALFSAYTLFTVYKRGDFAELMGSIWIALLMMFALRDLRNPGAVSPRLLSKATAPTAILLAAAWLSNPTVGVMASYLFAALALTSAAMLRSRFPALRAIVSAFLGMGLAAFYWVPAWFQQRWVAIQNAVDDPGERIENSFLFARHASPALQQHDSALLKASFVAVCMVGLSLVATIVAWRRRSLPEPRRWWIPLALIPPIILLLQLPFTLPLWNALPKLRYLQFPWRWLVTVEAPMALLLAAAIWPRTRRAQILVSILCTVFFLGSAGVAGVLFHQVCHPEDTASAMWAAYTQNVGFEGTEEYSPRGADNSDVAIGLPDACLVADPEEKLGGGDPDLTPEWTPDQKTCAATYSFASPNREHLRLYALLPHAGYLVLHLRRYPAWRVRVNGRPAGLNTQREDGLIAVAVPAGPVHLTVEWTATPDVRIGRWITSLSLAVITALWLLPRRRPRTQLK